MFKIISVSNRKLCNKDFLERISEISNAGIPVILREKDLNEAEYEELAKKVIALCPNIILHSFTNAAKNIGCKRIHLPMHVLRDTDVSGFEITGTSVHSPEEAKEAQTLGASYITAGHIFETDCKKGLAPRGLDFLENVCQSVNIPVYAIGGINSENAREAISRGASGVCVMSGLMTCENVSKYLSKYY